MKPVALFLVKNGIGYGHIRRALLIAGALARRGELSPPMTGPPVPGPSAHDTRTHRLLGLERPPELIDGHPVDGPRGAQ